MQGVSLSVQGNSADRTIPANALIVVDVQNAFIAGRDAVHDHQQLCEAIQLLLDRARQAKTLVIFLQNDGPPGAVDEPDQPGWDLYFSPGSGESVVRKTKDDGFDGSELNQILAESAARRIVICGMLSEMCVAATVRAAIQRGFEVILPHDGHATYDVPAGPGGSGGVPAKMAARAAEWSLGDEVTILASVRDVRFARPA
jgi:nicotinamidase-related amidase